MTCKQDTQRGGTSHTARGGKIEPRKLAQIKIFSYLCSVKTKYLTSEGDTQNTPELPF